MTESIRYSAAPGLEPNSTATAQEIYALAVRFLDEREFAIAEHLLLQLRDVVPRSHELELATGLARGRATCRDDVIRA